MYDYERELEPLKELRNQGVILKVYSAAGRSLGVSPEENRRLQKLEEDGLILQIYDLATGHFWGVD
jgi:DNA-binding Lrp family transcriptional regulator